MEEDDIHIRALLGVLGRHVLLIGLTISMIMAVAILYAYSRAPTYSASTLILIDPVDKNILASERGYENSNLYDVRVDGEIVILRSDAVSLGVVQAAALMNDPEFGLSEAELNSNLSPTALLKTVIQNIQDATHVHRQGETYLISVGITAKNPERAAELTNILANVYIANQIATKVESIEKVAAILRLRLGEARMALAQSDSAFNRYIFENIASIETATGRTDLAALNAEFTNLKARASESERRLTLAEQSLQNQNWQSIAELLQNEAILSLEKERQAAAEGLNAAANGTQASIELRLELARIDTALNEEAAAALQGFRVDASRMSARVSAAQTQMRQSVLAGDLPPALLTRIYELQQSSSITRSQYDNFLTRLRDVELQAELQVADARVVSPALPPLKPSSQSKPATLILASIFALFLAVGLAFLNEFFVGGFTNEEQLSNALQLPVAARIPLVSQFTPHQHPTAEPSAAESIIAQPMSSYAEAIRRLRASLDQSLAGHPESTTGGKVIMVASALPGEGKTNTALALGRTYARSGLRTLLIDCDLRKPRVHKILGVEPNSDILRYLTDGQNADNIFSSAHTDHASSLSILRGAGRSHVPTDQLLVGPRFSNLIHETRCAFDIVILDTPPLLPLVDGLYLAPYADVIALMVKWASTRQQDARSVLSALFEAKSEPAEVLAVLSHERDKKFGYYRKYASYYRNHEVE